MDQLELPITAVGAYSGSTYLHPAIAALLLILCAMVLMLDRSYVIIPFLIAQTFITWAQRIYVGGMNLNAMRIMIIFAGIRIILRREGPWMKPMKIDKLIIVYGVASTIAYTLQSPSVASFGNALGAALDGVGGYFTMRVLVRDDGDIDVFTNTLSYLGFIVVAMLLVERATGYNFMSNFGGVPASPELREGRLRVQGAYPHPILAGTYWAAAFPFFFFRRWRDGTRQPLQYVACAISVAIVGLCASSTPVMSLAIGICACILYYQRSILSNLVLLALALIIGLSILMNNPVWYLFAKIDVAGGSTGYHRYVLTDQFFRHWQEWLMIGVRDTFHWGRGIPLEAPQVGLADITNQFIVVAIRGGLVSLAAYIGSIASAIGCISKIVKSVESSEKRQRAWGLAVSLCVHMFSFLGVSYFGQVTFTWWMTLAFCGSLFQTLYKMGSDEDAASARLAGSPA